MPSTDFYASWDKTYNVGRKENCASLGYYAARRANSLTTFRDNHFVPIFGIQEFKMEY